MRPNAGRGMRRSNNRGGAPRGHGGGSRNIDTGRLPSLVDMDRPSPLMREPTAPLVSNHLQDLDMELALLKLKREIIEQQHQMLSGASASSDRFSSGSRQSQYKYDPPQQSYGQQQRYKEPASASFAQYYDDAPSGSQSRRHASKRAAAWRESQPAPKRHHADSPRDRQPAQPKPWTAKPKDRRDFQPKGAKPAPRARPEGKPVAKAAAMQTQPDLVLREGKEPTRQMSGRLELALGSVLKEMREAFPAEMGVLTGAAMRAVKQAIRERVHAAMLGRVVGSGPDIVRRYRELHPPATDIDIIRIGQAADRNTPTHKLAMTILEADDPDLFFKQNLNKLLNIKLDEMFVKLQELYKETDTTKTVNNMLDVFVNEEGWILEPLLKNEETASGDGAKTTEVQSEEAKADEQEDKNEEKAQSEDKGNNEDKKKVSKDELVIIDTVGETSDGNGTKTGQSTDINEEPKNDTLKEAKTESDTSNNDSQIEEKTVADTDTSQNESQNDSQAEQKMDVDTSEFAEDITDFTDQKQSKPAEFSESNVGKMEDGYPYRKKFKSAFYSRLMEALLRKRLPYLLPKFKDHIIRILNLQQDYKNTIAYMMVKTKKLEMEAKEAGKDVSKTTPQKTKQPLLFVKILGKPCLPKRNKMQTFLDQFHPATIKKHRGVHNLLFVGFHTKEDFDGILAASPSVIDNSILEIKESQKTKNAQASNSLNTTDSQNTSDVKIDADLDNQISDLLNSIRGDEETKLKETEDNLTEALKDGEAKISSEKDAATVDVEDDKSGNQKQENDKPDEATGTTENLDDTIILDNDDASEIQKENDTIVIEDDDMNGKAEANGEKVAEEKENANLGEIAEENENENKDDVTEEGSAKNEAVETVKNASKDSGGTTPARASARKVTSTPSTIRTRRTSRLAQNQNN